MKVMLSLFIALLLGTLVSTALLDDNGYAQLAYGDTVVEMSLLMLAGILLVAFLLLHWALRTLSWVRHIPSGVSGFWSKRMRVAADKAMTQGFSSLEEGQLRVAEKAWVKSAKNKESSLVSYLMAARVAHLQGRLEHREKYLALAKEENPKSALSVDIARAELLMDAKEYDEALNQLDSVLADYPNHKQIIRLILQCHEALGNCLKLADFLPIVKRFKAVSTEELERLHKLTFKSQCEVAETPEALAKLWSNLTRSQRIQAEFLLPYAHRSIELKATQGLQKILQDSLKKQWNMAVLKMYVTLPFENSHEALNNVEHWLKTYPEDAELLMLAGELAARQEMVGMAQSYLERARSIQDSPEVRKCLAKLHIEMNQRDKALELLL